MVHEHTVNCNSCPHSIHIIQHTNNTVSYTFNVDAAGKVLREPPKSESVLPIYVHAT